MTSHPELIGFRERIKSLQDRTDTSNELEELLKIWQTLAELKEELDTTALDVTPDDAQEVLKKYELIHPFMLLGEFLLKDVWDDMDETLKDLWSQYEQDAWFDEKKMYQMEKSLHNYNKKTDNIPEEEKELKNRIQVLDNQCEILNMFRALLHTVVELEPSPWVQR